MSYNTATALRNILARVVMLPHNNAAGKTKTNTISYRQINMNAFISSTIIAFQFTVKVFTYNNLYI